MTKEERERTIREKVLGNAPADMTREEAIARIQEHMIAHKMKEPRAVLISVALDMAVNALKQEPCEDAISRQIISDYVQSHILELNTGYGDLNSHTNKILRMILEYITKMPGVTPTQKWIPVSEGLPETDNKNEINEYNVLLWVANKTHPEREPQIYLGKLKKINSDDGSGNFWGIKTKLCDWTIWGWCYFNEPEVIAWMPLPEPYKESEQK